MARQSDQPDWIIRLVLAFGANLLALWLAARWIDGVSYGDLGDLAIAAGVLAVANLIVKPILTFVSCILIVLTLGLFLFLINMGMVALTAWIVPGFTVGGFWSAAGTAVFVWLANLLVGALFERTHKKPKSSVLDR